MIGIDIVKVERIKNLFTKDKNNKVFTIKEIDYALSKSDKLNQDGVTSRMNTFAGLYAAKEAFLKALGWGFGKGLELNEIEILHGDNGEPYFQLSAKIKVILKNIGASQVYLSVSHDGGMATAIVQIL